MYSSSTFPLTLSPPSISSASGETSGQEFICGTPVRMLFDDVVWYNGKVSTYDVTSKNYSIEFEDDDIQETALPVPLATLCM